MPLTSVDSSVLLSGIANILQVSFLWANYLGRQGISNAIIF